MAIIGFPQLVDAEINLDDKFIRTYKRVYQLFATLDFDEDDVVNGLDIRVFNAHPKNPFAVVTGIQVKLKEPTICTYDPFGNPGNAEPANIPANGTKCYVWIATINYGPWNPLTHTDDGDPFSQPVQIFYDPQTFQEAADKDKDGNPVVNAAFDSFDPAPQRDKTRPIIRAVHNEPTFSMSLAASLADCVNSDQILDVDGAVIYEARTLKIACPRGNPQFSQEKNITYYQVEYQFAINHNTWDIATLNQGYRELDDSGNRRPILVNGQTATTPVMLDESGVALLPPVDKDNVNYVSFRVYDEVSFADNFPFLVGKLT